MLHYCNMVRWAWLDWGLSGWLTTLLQYFDTVGWVIRPVKTVGRITYIVLVQTLIQSINQLLICHFPTDIIPCVQREYPSPYLTHSVAFNCRRRSALLLFDKLALWVITMVFVMLQEFYSVRLSTCIMIAVDHSLWSQWSSNLHFLLVCPSLLSTYFVFPPLA